MQFGFFRELIRTDYPGMNDSRCIVMRIQVFVFLAFSVLLTGSVAAQDRIKDDPGYAEFGNLASIFDRTPSLEVNLHGALLRLVAASSRDSDPDLAELLADVKAIYVTGFHLRRSEFRKAIKRNDVIARRLERDGWESAVSVRDESADIHMYVQMRRGEIVGMAVMSVSVDEGESVYLNIVGNIDPEQIGRIGEKFDLESLRDW
jgi:Domain of unknown function (DUF4252)